MSNKLVSRISTVAFGLGLFGLVATQAGAIVPGVETIGTPAAAVCAAPNGASTLVQHFDKIVFSIETVLVAANQNDQVALNNIPKATPLDIKVRDNPRLVADIKAKVLTFLMAAVTPANRAAINIQQVTYAVICGPTPTIIPVAE